MDNQILETVIEILKSEKPLPQEYQEVLFPINHKECELSYKNKKSREAILSVGNEPQAVPFQVEKYYNGSLDCDWQNLLICGDNFQALKTIYENRDSLIKDKVKGKVKLIYIDPPFATESDFAAKDGEKAYSDKIKGAEFIEFLRERLILAREILSDDGVICVHLDFRKKHYIKVIMDEIFDESNFKNEIAVLRTKKNVRERTFVKKLNEEFDTILMYSKTSNGLILPPQKMDFKSDRWHNLEAAGYRTGMDYEIVGVLPAANHHWRWEKSKVYEAVKNYELWFDNFSQNETLGEYWSRTGKKKKFIRKNGNKIEYFLPSTEEVLCNNLWNDIPAYSFSTDYPTEKSVQMLSRIIEMCTNTNDLVMDFFAGSGTTLIAAEKLGRRWIGCDIGKLSIYTIQKRLLTMAKSVKPFCLVNAGCYNLNTVFELDKNKYYDFVLDLFHIDRKKSKINGVSVDGKRRGDWVKVFAFQDFTETTAIDESYIRELHAQIGGKINDRFYLIAPEMNIDIIGDYFKIDNVKYYLLRIPYQVIAELHKLKFKKLQQPHSKDNINSIENSVGFYFNEMPEVKTHIKNDDKTITIFIDSITSPYLKLDDNNEQVKDILAMVITDMSDNEDFIMQKVFFADDIKTTDGYKFILQKDIHCSRKLKIIYIDIYGNEFKEVLEID